MRYKLNFKKIMFNLKYFYVFVETQEILLLC